ncbi:maleylacetoacetate isomerase [Paracoccus tegillarcae]|uniref:Maleylacetoacetate isomerase n=1 Tax=Paracoccus tegillarcae TaxID=1529068 RepID=A0A2K9EHV3_9RHOB|nr:maleylacetoacetate isomerase [Paracoccus tegillarcae]AUH34578.1 maleylacetoacetate isomerase [Paracoccus tegillarcae]
MITLYDYWRSSASYRVRIALGLAGLDWQSIPVDLVEGAQRSPEHLARNPQGLVPVIEIDGHRFSQSLAIIDYLDETRGLGLLPGNAENRAHIRAIAHAMAIDIHPICNLGTARFAVAASNGGLTMKDWMQHFIAPGLAAVEEMLPGDDYCWGETVTLADICLIPQLYNAERWGVDLSALPRIRRVAGKLAPIPAFAAAHPDHARP